MKQAVLILAIALAWGTPARAQMVDLSPDASTGVKQNGSYFSGGLDNIGLYNGNLNVTIPILSFPGREISRSISAVYNSQKWEVSGSSYYTGGWKIGKQGGYFNVEDDLTDCVDDVGKWIVQAVWIDVSGARRGFSIDPDNPSATVDGGCLFTPPNTELLANDKDGSILTLEWDSELSQWGKTLKTRDGITITQGGTTTRNGNFLVSDTIYGDTLGRSVSEYYGASGCASGADTCTIYTVTDANGDPETYKVNYDDGHSVYNPLTSSSLSLNRFVSSITLPNGMSYNFEYSHHQGFLTKVILPGGGYIRFLYQGCSGSGTCEDHNASHDRVIARYVAPDGSTEGTPWQYSTPTDSSGTRTVTVTNPDGTLVDHDYTIATGLESETRWKSASSGNPVIQTVHRTWEDGRPKEVTTTDGSLSQLTEYEFDAQGRPTEMRQSDWYPGSTVLELAKTVTDYETLAHGLVMPSAVTVSVWNGSGYSMQSKTEYDYDEDETPAEPSDINYVPAWSTPSGDRGNVTTIRRYTDDTEPSSAITEHFAYDVLGNMILHLDPLGNQTEIDYTDNFVGTSGHHTYAFPKIVTNDLGHTVTTAYHYYTSLPVSTTGARGEVTTISYDLMNRPTLVLTQVGSTDIAKTTYAYNDSSRTVTEAAYVEAGKTITTTTYFDQIGRPVSAVLTDPADPVHVDTAYDGNGRPYWVTQPYRSGTPAYSVTAFDALGRPVTVTNPDTTTVSFAYTANAVTATDEAGVQKRQTFDGLGRLTAVAVPDPSETSPSLADPLTTVYEYGPSSESGYAGLVQFTVKQHDESAGTPQTRKFIRDWAGRLVYESHPETGVNTYGWNAASQLTWRIDARGSGYQASYEYDNLGRMTQVEYEDGTPTVTRTYDEGGAAYRGLLTTVTVGASNSDVTTYTYNAAGQVASENRTFYGISGTFSSNYTYDLGGRMLTATYPSGRVVTYGYQYSSADASNRISSIVDSTTSKTLVSSVVDNAAGLVTSRTLGTTTSTKIDQAYNDRNQLTDIVATQNTGATTLLDLEYAYGGSSGATANVGRIRSRTDAVEPEQSVAYTYDAMYRLKSVSRTNTSTPTWSIAWTFDEWGNRTAQTPDGLGSVVGSQSRAYSANRVTGDSAVTYDSGGNMTADGSSLTYQWDAESRLKSVNSGSITYGYDGEGRRVKKTSGGVTTYYMYGITGLQSEFSTVSGATAAASTDRLTFRVPEHNGTGVLLLDSAGNLVENNRVLPYGEPFRAVSGSTNDDKFTSYNRDPETGQDYAMARHYASKYGAFLSPDPGHAGADPNDPKSWNAYLYVGSDPINFVDLEGMWATWIHEMIIQQAFPFLKKDQLKVLMQVSFAQDNPLNGGFNPSHSPQHAMCNPGDSKKDGMERFRKYVADQKALAKSFQANPGFAQRRGNELIDRALQAFGRALHAEMDNLAYAHEGCQIFEFRKWQAHTNSDNTITPERLEVAIRRAQSVFNETFGYPTSNLWGINEFDLLELYWRQFEHVDIKITFGPAVE